MEDGSFDLSFGGEDGGRLAGGTQDLVDKVGNCDFAGGTGDTNEA